MSIQVYEGDGKRPTTPTSYTIKGLRLIASPDGLDTDLVLLDIWTETKREAFWKFLGLSFDNVRLFSPNLSGTVVGAVPMDVRMALQDTIYGEEGS